MWCAARVHLNFTHNSIPDNGRAVIVGDDQELFHQIIIKRTSWNEW